ncbi:hypothetical protein MTR_3g035510 [Medicago truncatula]|uniref:Transmembrane protein n=1 Tax=Medicago truncatula TaxID=3880 RepID=G7J0Z1_MEDTR|nr:hypothetical protein MTR_3g035510 [Medicago truncatula]
MFSKPSLIFILLLLIGLSSVRRAKSIHRDLVIRTRVAGNINVIHDVGGYFLAETVKIPFSSIEKRLLIGWQRRKVSGKGLLSLLEDLLDSMNQTIFRELDFSHKFNFSHISPEMRSHLQM